MSRDVPQVAVRTAPGARPLNRKGGDLTGHLCGRESAR